MVGPTTILCVAGFDMEPPGVFARYANGLDLYLAGNAPIRIPSNFQLLSGEELERKPFLLDQLVRLYQEVFGAPDIWSEGAFCTKNGNHLVSLSEYQRKVESGNLRCHCGGALEPCYPFDTLRDRIVSQVAGDRKSFCAVMWNDTRLCGFIWGLVASTSVCLQRILHSRYQGIDHQWKRTVQHLHKALERLEVHSSDEFLFVDELGVLKDARRGLSPFLYLVRFGLTHALGNECERMLFWTSRKSPIYKFSRLADFQEILHTPEGIVFLICKNITPILKVLQNREPSSVLPLLLSSARTAKTADMPEKSV